MARNTEVDLHIKNLIVKSGVPIDVLETASQGNHSRQPSRTASVASQVSHNLSNHSKFREDVEAGLRANQV
jgi:hypothetical protein